MDGIHDRYELHKRDVNTSAAGDRVRDFSFASQI